MSSSSSAGWRAARGSRCSAMRSTDWRSEPWRASGSRSWAKTDRSPAKPGSTYLERRAGNWDCTWEAITGLDNVEAIAYLRQPGRIAVMPSLMDNSPLAVQECLLAGVPFLATGIGGIPEMIRPEDRAEVLFAPRPAALADRLERVLREGLAVPGPAVDERESRRSWLDWHNSLPRREQVKSVEASASVRPLVSVCVTHHNRPHYLAQALDSLRRQDYSALKSWSSTMEVRSPSPWPTSLTLESEFRDRGWQIIRQANLYPGAARNNAARARPRRLPPVHGRRQPVEARLDLAICRGRPDHGGRHSYLLRRRVSRRRSTASPNRSPLTAGFTWATP